MCNYFLFHSGFEDDFSVSDFKISSRAASTTFTNDPFDCLDDFSSAPSQTTVTNLPVRNIHGNIRNMKPLIQPKPAISIGNTNFYTSNPSSEAPSPANFEDTLSNGKNLTMTKPSVVSMPTIIKPALATTNRKVSSNQVPIMKKSLAPLPPQVSYKPLDSGSDESFEDEPPSPPMPTIPAPVLIVPDDNALEDDQEKESYGIALYDFDSEVTEDLSFKVSQFRDPQKLKCHVY